MKKFNLITVSGLFSTGLLLSNVLLAHASLSESAPADGAVVNEAPEKLELSFTEDVRLLNVSVKGEENREVETDFAPSPQAASRFSLELPALEEGAYTVDWTMMGADSHRVEGKFSFTVDAEASEVTGSSGADHAGHTGH